ncbi:MAG: hypothetical protein HY653_03880 [Acidobacteria bacterium]|nr:hypothetical protein [Acidobacteriota bacterium]
MKPEAKPNRPGAPRSGKRKRRKREPQWWLAWVQARAVVLASLLRHRGESDEALLVRKMVLAALLSKSEQLQKMKIKELLRESREILKATRDIAAKPDAAPKSSEDVQRKVREIYGWPEEELAARLDSSKAGDADNEPDS